MMNLASWRWSKLKNSSHSFGSSTVSLVHALADLFHRSNPFGDGSSQPVAAFIKRGLLWGRPLGLCHAVSLARRQKEKAPPKPVAAAPD
jgi:hypothetical protein